MSRAFNIEYKYAVGQRVSWLNPIGQRLYGAVEQLAGRASGRAMYWIRVDGSRPGYYPNTIIQHEFELTPLAAVAA
jgi:hypothetical protein